MGSATDFLVMYVCPTLGNLCALFIFVSPLAEIFRIRRSGDIGTHNPVPYPMFVSNCMAWVLYSFLKRDYFIFFGNFVGTLFGLFYSLSCIQSAKSSDRSKIELLLVGGPATVLIGGVVSFISLGQSGPAAQEATMGMVCVGVLLLFYSSPLSTLVTVIRTRDSSSFFFPLSLTSFLNGAFWTVYGIARGDMFIAGPNGMGVLFAAVQMLCICIFPKGGKGLQKAGLDDFSYNSVQSSASM